MVPAVPKGAHHGNITDYTPARGRRCLPVARGATLDARHHHVRIKRARHTARPFCPGLRFACRHHQGDLIMPIQRYSAHTIDGTPVKVSETAQQISDAVINHMKENRRPHIAYTFDNLPGTVWPYTTWKQSEVSGIWIGSPWKTFDEVIEAVKH